MELKYKLINHTFYQKWSKGELTQNQISDYHKSYSEFIRVIPLLWAKIVNDYKLEDFESDKIVKDETEHILLWDLWGNNLPVIDDFHSMSSIINELSNLNTSELLGAIHAFEIQQPEIAETKKKGLMEFYGFDNDSLKYFDEHMSEQYHINYAAKIASDYADTDEFNRGFELGAKLIYNSLDLYLN